TGEAAADDAHVGRRIAVERRRGVGGLAAGFVQPPRRQPGFDAHARATHRAIVSRSDGLLWQGLPMAAQAEKGAAFAALHNGAPFVIPNPWDAGSARVLAALGFEALATTSSGYAYTLGRLDGGVTLDEMAEHVASL